MKKIINLEIAGGKTISLELEDVLLIDSVAGPGKNSRRVKWITRKGDFIQARRRRAAQSVRDLGENSGFIFIGQGLYLNLRRLHSITWDPSGRKFHLTLDWGAKGKGKVVEANHMIQRRIARELGFPHLFHPEPMPPEHKILWQLGLRDYPEEIFTMTRRELLRCFCPDDSIDVDRLIANLIWQCYRYRCLGRPPSYNVSTMRGFMYRPVGIPLQTLGLFNRAQREPGDGALGPAATEAPTLLPEWLQDQVLNGEWGELIGMGAGEGWGAGEALEADQAMEAAANAAADADELPGGVPAAGPGRSKDYYYGLMQKIMARMVGEYRLFTYGELGFHEPRPDLHLIGDRHPEVVLLVEKENLFHLALEANRRWGISAFCAGGTPTLVSTEFFCQKLRATGAQNQALHLVTLVDYDPFGWIIAGAFRDQAARFGIDFTSPRHLVLPSRFTAREIRTSSFPLTSKSAQIRGIIRKWMAECGGINRKRRGIGSDHLWPDERVFRIMEEVCGDLLGEAVPGAAGGSGRHTGSKPRIEDGPMWDNTAIGHPAVVWPDRVEKEIGRQLAALGNSAGGQGMVETPIYLPSVDRLVLLGPGLTGLVFVPPAKVETIRNEHQGRLEFVTRSGEVFHLSRSLVEVERVLGGGVPRGTL